MHALIVYESMFGNTHAIADDIAEGLRPMFDVTVVPVKEATDELVAEADLLVRVVDTRPDGLSGDVSRRAAMEMADDEETGLEVDDEASRPGLAGVVPRLRTAACRRGRVDEIRGRCGVDRPGVLGDRAPPTPSRLRDHRAARELPRGRAQPPAARRVRASSEMGGLARRRP